MKKLLAIILAIITIFSLSACKDKGNDGGEENPGSQSTIIQPITDGGSFTGSNYHWESRNDDNGNGENSGSQSNVIQPITNGGSFTGSNYQ